MQSKEKDNLVFLRLFQDESIYDCLKLVCEKHKVKTAVVLSGLGQLGLFELGFFKAKGDYAPQKYAVPYELLSLTGSISLQDSKCEFHLHAVLGGEQKQVLGGHFLNGIVSITAEIVLLKTDLEIKRQTEEATGLRGLFLE